MISHIVGEIAGTNQIILQVGITIRQTPFSNHLKEFKIMLHPMIILNLVLKQDPQRETYTVLGADN